MKQKRLTAAAPKIVDGVTFRCFKTGIQRFEWMADGAPISVRRNFQKLTYSAYWDGVLIGSRFQTEEAAMRAAIKARANRARG